MDNVGLRWYKCDFHLHTMVSKCYENQGDSPEEWVEKVKEAGLQCIAITDHNDYRGVDEIKKLCEDGGIVAFPGVELSCDSSKIHMLIIFDSKKSGNKVREFLNTVGIYEDDIGSSEHTCNGDIREVCKEAKKQGALVIAAHIDEYNGIGNVSHGTLQLILDREYIDAVQVVNERIWKEHSAKNISGTCEKLTKKYKRPIHESTVKDWYRAYEMARKSDIPIVTFSDNPCYEGSSKHGLWGIGEDYTWLKMNESPDIESVRQALLSHDMRVKAKFDSGLNPSGVPDLWIRSLKFANTTLNADEVEVSFNPQLNTIIGGRGSGKSSIIRMLAGGMQAFNADALDNIKQEQERFYKLSKKEKGSKEKTGIFNENSKIEIVFERNKDIYRMDISNIQGMNAQKRELYKLDGNEWVEIDNPEFFMFFDAQVYTQKQIYELAHDSGSLMNTIDEGIEGIEQAKTERDKALDDIIAKRFEIYDIQKRIDNEGKVITELRDIEDQISKYNNSGVAPALKDKQRYEDEDKGKNDYISRRREAVEKIRAALDESNIEIGQLSIESQELKGLIENDNGKFKAKLCAMREILNSIDADEEEFLNTVDGSDWNKQRQMADSKYKEACEKLQEQEIDSGRLDDLIEKKKGKTAELEGIQTDKRKKQEAEDELGKLEAVYDEKIEKISEIRRTFIKDILGKDSTVKFEIQKNRSMQSFVDTVRSVIGKEGARIDDDIEKMRQKFFGTQNDGKECFRNCMQEIRDGRETKTFTKTTRDQIINMQPESFARLISFVPEDDLRVSYRPAGSNTYIPLSNASAGQKTTAMLTFLLAHGSKPLLLDQPEDDLDNKLVYDLIVSRLKNAKSLRQIIVVTHNANIPVNADSEYIISMDSETDKISIKHEGTMDDEDIRHEICDVMEGTKFAFEMRAKKYHFRIIE